MKKTITLLLLLVAVSFTFAQEQTIQGVVSSVDNNKPLNGVAVRIKGSKIVNSFTNEEGKYKLTYKEPSANVLVFSLTGYDDFETEINKQTTINVQMTLEKRLNAYGQEVTRVPMNAEMRNGIITFESDNQKFKLWTDVRIYIDAAHYFDNINPLTSGTELRRGRFALKSILWSNWYGELDLDFADNDLEVKDAYLQRNLTKNSFVRVGNFKQPFSMEETTTSRYLTFMERGLPNAFTTDRYIGALYSRYGQHYFAAGGIFSQGIDNPARKDQNKDVGDDEGYGGVARIAYFPINEPKKLIHIGAAGMWRKPDSPEYGDPMNSVRFRQRPETHVSRKKFLDTDYIEHTTDYKLLGFEVATKYGPFSLQSEYIKALVSREAGYENASFDGFYVYGTWIVTGETRPWNAREAEFTQIRPSNSYGALEVAMRYSTVNLNDFNADITGGQGENVTFGVNWYVNTNVKFMLNYILVNNDRYADGKGKLDANFSAPAGKGGDDFSFIQVRAEIDF